jgi:hypothetical protein
VRIEIDLEALLGQSLGPSLRFASWFVFSGHGGYIAVEANPSTSQGVVQAPAAAQMQLQRIDLRLFRFRVQENTITNGPLLISLRCRWLHRQDPLLFIRSRWVIQGGQCLHCDRRTRLNSVRSETGQQRT